MQPKPKDDSKAAGQNEYLVLEKRGTRGGIRGSSLSESEKVLMDDDGGVVNVSHTHQQLGLQAAGKFLLIGARWGSQTWFPGTEGTSRSVGR